MNFHVLTLFPEMIEQGIHNSITGRALDRNLISVHAINMRDFSENRYGQVDDYPYGGGAGMVIQPGPVYRSYESIVKTLEYKPRVVYLTPQGKVFDQSMAEEFSKEKDIVFLCGHYEGIDERVLDMIVTDHISIGDYVLTGGELPAMVMMDAISRLVPGVLNNDLSAEFESFYDNLLEYPQYTRPAEFMGMEVPEILLSGNHQNVDRWRREQSLKRTYQRRPDMLETAHLSREDLLYLESLREKKENPD